MCTRDSWLRVLVTLGAALVLALLALWLLSGRAIPRANAGLARCASFAPLPTHMDPDANALNVPLTSSVSITFDEPISLTSISTRTFAVYGSQSPIVTGIYSLDSSSQTVTLDPTRALFPGERVDATVTTCTLSITGQQAISATVWQFWAGVQGGSGRLIDSGQSLGSSNTHAVALGDLDNDGDLDAFVGNYGGQADRVWLNDGAGTLVDSSQSLGSSDTRAVALGDVDGDGDLDAFVGNYSGQADGVWLNNGAGAFIDSGQALGSSYGQAVALGDVDGDGDLDAFVGNVNQANRVWLNDGGGTFVDSGQTLGSSNTRAVTLGDLDADGDLDAFVANQGQPNRVWLNDGAGSFVDSGQSLGSSNSQAAVLGDLDGDGDLDAIVGNVGQGSEVWLNGGQGTFNIAQGLGDADSWAVALGDLDGDGDLDTFVGNDGPNEIWLGSGGLKGVTPAPNTHTAAITANLVVTLSSPVSQSTVTSQTFSVHGGFHGRLEGAFSFGSIVFDPTEDFYPGELVEATVTGGVLAGSQPIEPYVWQFRAAAVRGSGIFVDSGQNLGSADSRAVALGDLDGDGDLDAFIGNGGPNKVWLNDGMGTFFDSGQNLGSSDAQAVVLGDLDGDGDLDAFVGNDGPNEVWLNDGVGIFVNSGQSLGASNSQGIVLGDLDADGDLDAFAANGGGFSQPNKVWLNDGTGTFVDSGQGLGSSGSWAVALGDVDGDGDLDAFVVNHELEFEPAKVWLNDGKGIFTDSGQNLDSDPISTDVALGDLDSDGDLDAFVTGGDLGSYSDQVWLNDGTGAFVDSGQRLGSSDGWAVALGDLDGDGDLDALAGNTYPAANTVWRNDGMGIFTSSQGFGDSHSGAVALGDLNGDGDLDVFVGNSDPNKIWLKLNLDLDNEIYLPLVMCGSW